MSEPVMTSRGTDGSPRFQKYMEMPSWLLRVTTRYPPPTLLKGSPYELSVKEAWQPALLSALMSQLFLPLVDLEVVRCNVL